MRKIVNLLNLQNIYQYYNDTEKMEQIDIELKKIERDPYYPHKKILTDINYIADFIEIDELMKFYQNFPSLYDKNLFLHAKIPEDYYLEASRAGLSETDAKFGEVHEEAKHLFNQGDLNRKKFRELIKERSNRDRVVSISRKFSEINNDFRTIVKSDYQDVKQEDMQRLFDASLASMQITLKPLIKRAIEQGLKPDPLYVSLAKLMEEENNEWRIF